jgi:hypothetical protein
MISGADIKRQILMSAGTSQIKKKMDVNPPGISDGEYIEMGNEIEKVTKLPGWSIIEAYMLRFIAEKLNSDKYNEEVFIRANAFKDLMHYIELTIQKKNDILERERLKHETKSVPKDNGE